MVCFYRTSITYLYKVCSIPLVLFPFCFDFIFVEKSI